MNLTIRVLADRNVRASRLRGDRSARGAALLYLTVADLADRDRDDSGDDLGLSIGKSGDDGGLYDARADDLAVGDLRGRGVCTAGDSDQRDRRALGSPVTVVQVEESSREAAVKGGVIAEGDNVVLAERETAGVDCASLGGSVKLVLIIGRDVAGASLSIKGGTILNGDDEVALRTAVGALLFSSLV